MSEEEATKRKIKTGHRRSLHDLDEENSRLRNENFNLKLRLHFKEHANEDAALRGDSNDALVKELNEAKALIQALREELAEKTQLLKDAAVAISEHEDRENEFVLESQAKIAVLEGCLAHLQHKEAPSRSDSYLDLQMPDQPSQFKEEMGSHEQYLIKIESLQRQLAERDIQMEDYDQKLKELSDENSDLIKLLQQHYRFSQMANQLMKTQKKELHACLIEKLTFIKRMNEILPELNCQKEMLKEATLAVQGLVETSDLKEQFSRETQPNCRAAIIESKAKASKKNDGQHNWTRNPGLKSSGGISDPSPRSSNASQINSDVSLPEMVAGAQAAQSVDDVPEEVGGAASSQGSPSIGRPMRTHVKSSFTGLRQFVKCWGRQYWK